MDKVEKEYKVTYKTFYNDRLKKSLFHTKLMHPLYVVVTFDRIPIYFKSYYYDLFSKPKYAIRVSGQVFVPEIKEIITKEETLIEFIVNKNKEEFSLDLFKKEYAFYSRDLLDMMEESFLDYLFIFLHDEGMPFLADVIKKGSSDVKLYDLVLDLKRSINPALYKRLIEHSFYYSLPYFPLYEFTEKPKQTSFRSLTVMEWEQKKTQEGFKEFFKKYYPEHDLGEAIKKIKKLVSG
jgi:hypothetical protein